MVGKNIYCCRFWLEKHIIIAVYENAVAQELKARGRCLHYFQERRLRVGRRSYLIDLRTASSPAIPVWSVFPEERVR